VDIPVGNDQVELEVAESAIIRFCLFDELLLDRAFSREILSG
jgi:hypothetical protein